jgi:two-component system chemotaxis sensor kinase CheA
VDLSRYLDLFVAEATEHLGSARDLAAQLERAPEDAEAWRGLFQHAHSLKGGAATMGFAEMAELAHALEDLLEAQRGTALVARALASLGRMLLAIERGAAPRDPDSMRLIQELRHAAGRVAADPGPTQSPAPHPTAPDEPRSAGSGSSSASARRPR